MEAHEIMNCATARIGELITVRRHFEELLREARGVSSQPTELKNRLRNAHLSIETMLCFCLGPALGLLAS
jgi:hypothetical protein